MVDPGVSHEITRYVFRSKIRLNAALVGIVPAGDAWPRVHPRGSYWGEEF